MRGSQTMHPHAIEAVEQHVQEKTEAYEASLRKERQYNVASYGKRLMQRMKAYAAAIRIVARHGQEMVQVDDHRGHHDQEGA